MCIRDRLWIVYKTEGEVRERARRIASRLWWAVAALVALITLFSIRLQPRILINLSAHPWGALFPAIAILGLILALWSHASRREALAFGGSAFFLAGMVASAAFGIHPNVLPSITDPARALTIANTAAPELSLIHISEPTRL